METENFYTDEKNTFKKAVIVITACLGLLGAYAIYSVFTADISWGFKINWNCFESPLFPVLAVLGFFLQFFNWQHFSMETWIGTKKAGESESARKWEKSNDITDVLFGGCLMPLLGHLIIVPCMIGAILWYSIMGLVHILGKLSPFFISALIIALVYFFFILAMKFAEKNKRVVILSVLTVAAGAILGATIYLMNNPDSLGASGNAPVKPELEPIGMCIITGNDVNLRQGPGTDYNKIGKTVSANESYPLLGESDGWAKIDYNGTPAWLSAKFCTLAYDSDQGMDDDDPGCWSEEDENVNIDYEKPEYYEVPAIAIEEPAREIAEAVEVSKKDPVAPVETNVSADIESTKDNDVKGKEKVMAGEKPKDDNIVYTTANIFRQPEFPGGVEAMYRWIGEHLQYPADAAEEGAQGRVTVEFVVSKTGAIENVKILRGRHPALDKEALRVVKAMPKWNPGRKEDGEPAKVTYILPIQFRLN